MLLYTLFTPGCDGVTWGDGTCSLHSRGMSVFERSPRPGHQSVQIDCGWVGNDKHWGGGVKYAGTPNNNLSKELLS